MATAEPAARKPFLLDIETRPTGARKHGEQIVVSAGDRRAMRQAPCR